VNGSFKDGRMGTSWAPGQMIFGDGSVARVGALLQEAGVTGGIVLVVADRDVSRLGLAQGAVDSLAAAGYSPTVYDEIAGEPTLENFEKLAAFARAAGAGAVVGVGGGSALDLAKVVATVLTHDGAVAQYVGPNKFVRPGVPLLLVPTTAGTGAEATRNAMVIAGGRKAFIISQFIVPYAAVLDPLLTVTLPARITAATGLDALSHAVESYMSTGANPFSRAMSLQAVSIIAHWLPTACREGSNLEARRAMLAAAYMAGLSLNGGAILGHSLAYTITNRTGLPHGVTCAMSLPYCVAYGQPGSAEALDDVARATGVAGVQSSRELLLWMHELNRELGIPLSLQAAGLPEKDLPGMADEVLSLYPRPNNPVPLARARLLELYHYFLTGDVAQAGTAMAALA